ncbi:MAG: hypothetical protein AAGF12_02685 [Myxococcota bacterium]
MRLAILIFALGSLGGCGHEPAPGEAVSEVCVSEHHEETVAVSGYLVPPTVTFGCTGSCTFYLSEERGVSEGGIRMLFSVGSGPRTMDAIEFGDDDPIPGQVERLSASDFVLRTDTGSTVGPGDTVRVQGSLTVRETDDGPDCTLRPTEVTAL